MHHQPYHHLIHKACGWMLREVGKSCGIKVLNGFLDEFANVMPRTMLRYALEKHPPEAKQFYMHLPKGTAMTKIRQKY